MYVYVRCLIAKKANDRRNDFIVLIIVVHYTLIYSSSSSSLFYSLKSDYQVVWMSSNTTKRQ